MVLSWRVTITVTLLLLATMTGEAQVQDIAGVLWTDEVIAAYAASVVDSSPT